MASPAPSFIEWGAQSFITTFANKNLTTNPLAGWPEPRP